MTPPALTEFPTCQRLCRYITHPAIVEPRLSLTPSGAVRYQLKTPYRDGTTHSIFELLDACGLPFHEDCLAFHRTKSSVKTPSAAQVRQPVYTASIGRWKHYKNKLLPLQAILEQDPGP